METSIPLDPDIVAAAQEIADRDHRSIAEVVSALARKGLEGTKRDLPRRNGFLVLPHRGVVVTPDLVNALRDDDE